MKVNTKCIFLVLLSFFSLTIMANNDSVQQIGKKITGIVVDDNKEPIIGASIMIQGTSTGTLTDLDGKFEIEVPDLNSKLRINFIGYQEETIALAGKTHLNVQLISKSHELDAVVAIGYGTAKKRDLTGAVASVKSADIALSPVTNAMEALQGKVAGLDITRTSGESGKAPEVLLRGNRSLTASMAPLYIIDGIAGNINNLNPNDIETIDILKDGSSTAIYGSEGANGVIIITTKQAEAGKVQVDFDAYMGINTSPSYLAPLTGQAWLDYKNEAFLAYKGELPNDITDLGLTTLAPQAIKDGKWINWVDETLQTGVQQNYNVSVRGGTEKTKGYMSLGYMSEKGIYKNDRSDTYTLRAGVDNKVNKWFSAGVQSYMTWKDNDRTNSRLSKGLSMLPLGDVYNEDGSVKLFPLESSSAVSPLANTEDGVYVSNLKHMQIQANPYLEFKPIKGLTLRSVLGATLTSQRAGLFEGLSSYNNASSASPKNSASYISDFNYGLKWENIATYNFAIAKDHNFTVTGVTSWSDSRKEKGNMSASEFGYDSFLYYNMNNGSNPLISTKFSKGNMQSYVGRITYNYKGKYILNVSNRWDGASQLYKHWASFPGASGAWRISDETFMKETSGWLDNLKLRAGYGVSGISGIDPYVSKTEVTSLDSKMTLGGANALPLYGLTQAVGNINLSWEKSYNLNIGLDFSLFNNRFDAILEWYDTKNKDILWKRYLPATSGAFDSKKKYYRMTNIADIHNRGFEATINTRNIITRDFKWNSTVTFAINKEKLTAIDLGSNVTEDRLVSEKLFVGHSPKAVYGFKKLGIWQLGEEEEAAKYGRIPGQIKIETKEKYDANGVSDGGYHTYSDYDKQVLGSETPDWTLGFQNGFTYKNIDLNILATMRWGQLIDSELLGWWDYNGDNIPSTYDYWTPNNPTNDYPRPMKGAAKGTDLQSLSIVDGSYFKIKNITLGYSLPAKYAKIAGISRLRVYGTVNNPFIITKSHLLKDIDPESGGGDSFPLYKQIVFGINLSF